MPPPAKYKYKIRLYMREWSAAKAYLPDQRNMGGKRIRPMQTGTHAAIGKTELGGKMSMKKITKKYRKAKGFTLVELLIVVIILGILAGMMLLSTGSAADRAEATKIVSDMRTIQTAALMYCLDNNNNWTTELASLDKYLDQDMTTRTDYALGGTGTKDEPIYVSYTKTPDLSAGVQAKLADMAANTGLYSDNKCTTKYASGTTVYLIVKKGD